MFASHRRPDEPRTIPVCIVCPMNDKCPGFCAARPADHSMSPSVQALLGKPFHPHRAQAAAWDNLQREVDAATPQEPAHSAPPAQPYTAPEVGQWSIRITDDDPGLRPGYWRVEVKRGPFVVYVWAGAPSYLAGVSAAEEFIRHRDATPRVVSCTTTRKPEPAPAPAPAINWEGDPLEVAFTMDIPEDVRDKVLHELKRREEQYDALAEGDLAYDAKELEDDFLCRLLAAFSGLRALALLILVGLCAVGCGDRPDEPDARPDAGAEVMPPCPQPAGTTFVFLPCDNDPALAFCEVRYGTHNETPTCEVQGRRCVASCTARADGGGQ